jgi:hypothetical protein
VVDLVVRAGDDSRIGSLDFVSRYLLIGENLNLETPPNGFLQ